ncbi:MAG: hypothetical protein D6732_02840 [Methanobacteriota archaeon]|nr:MAG: hypothetical protein D6732_02840 [Euryarchaeota archaeon]
MKTETLQDRVKLYEKTVRGIANQFSEAVGRPPKTWKEFGFFLGYVIPSRVKKSTWTTYVSHSKAFLRLNEKFKALDSMLIGLEQASRKREEEGKSENFQSDDKGVLKGIPKERLELLAEHARKSKNGGTAIQFLRAGAATGLRPHEWQFASYNPITRFLTVSNFKLTHTAGKGDIQPRRIPVDHLSPIELLSVQGMIALAEDRVEFTARQVASRVWLSNKCKELFEDYRGDNPSITMMTARHQFCSNLKKHKVPIIVCAYWMGHLNTSRTQYYGQASLGWDGVKVPSVKRLEDYDYKQMQMIRDDKKGGSGGGGASQVDTGEFESQIGLVVGVDF